MRILLVHNFYQISGGEDRIVNEESAMLARAGASVELFSTHNDAITGAISRASAAFRVVYNRRASQDLFKILKSFAPDVVHIHNFFPLLSPSILDACLAADVPAVLTLHNFRILSPGALLHPAEEAARGSLKRSCWSTVPHRVYRDSAAATLAVAAMIEFHRWAGTWTRKVSRFIALTEWAKQMFAEGGLPADRIMVKPNSVAGPASLGAGPRKGALYVGRLDEPKGIGLLLRAWQHTDCPLRIIGDGPLTQLVSQHAGGNITYLGRQPSAVVRQEMQSAAFLVLPSTRQEMFPVTIVEAFSNGLPVLCADLPSIAHLVKHGVTGLQFTANDEASLARQAAWAGSNAGALLAMGCRARAAYQAHYTPEANVERLFAVYAAAKADPALATRH